MEPSQSLFIEFKHDWYYGQTSIQYQSACDVVGIYKFKVKLFPSYFRCNGMGMKAVYFPFYYKGCIIQVGHIW